MILPQVHLRNGDTLLSTPSPGKPDYILSLPARQTHHHLVCERHPCDERRLGLGCGLPIVASLTLLPHPVDYAGHATLSCRHLVVRALGVSRNLAMSHLEGTSF